MHIDLQYKQLTDDLNKIHVA